MIKSKLVDKIKNIYFLNLEREYRIHEELVYAKK